MRIVLVCLPAVIAVVAIACGGGDGGDEPEIGLPDRKPGEEDSGVLPSENDAGASDGGTKSDPDASADASVGCNGATDCERVVFVTKQAFLGGQVGGLAGADQKCQAAADSATASARVKGRKFYAWLSTLATTAASRHPHGTKPYVQATSGANKTVANNWTDLTDGNLVNGINLDESGTQVSASPDRTWTGTNANGGSSNSTCGDWANNAANGQRGNIGGPGGGWTDIDTVGCGNTARLYCFEY